MAKRVVIAVGGNAILQPHQAPTFEARLCPYNWCKF